MDKYLPIGSIVLLKGGKKKIMIYGRKQISVNNGQMYDYVACFYPEGNISENYTFLFNHVDIEKVIFEGYSDEEEVQFQTILRNND